MIDSGLFREVGSLFDQYAGETWKNAMAIDDNVWNPYTRDGQRMGIPVLDYAYNHDYLLWIRQDWLDKLSLPAPTTLEELEVVMDKFKNANPDGLKPDQVTPLSIGFKNKMSTWMGDPSWIFGAYGTLPEQWNVGADGKEATTRLEKEVQTAYGLETPGAAKVLLSQEGASFKDMFTGPPTETMTSKNDYLKKLELQVFNEIIYGKKPIEAFDQFVSDWKAGGGDKMTDEVNAWYDSVK